MRSAVVKAERSHEPHYRQYILVGYGESPSQMVCWLPEAISQVAVIDGRRWQVFERSTIRIPESYLLEYERDHKYQREASDV